MAAQDKKTGKFTSGLTDDDLYEIVGLVALHVNKQRPEKLTQASFDAVAAAVAKKNKKPTPPSARAIHMRLQIEWKKIVADAVRAARGESSTAIIVGQSKRSDEWPDLDERHIFYALHRVARFLELETVS
jgi:hypothetical protein